MYCRYCGKQIPDDAIFCSYCGKDLRYNPDNQPVWQTKADRKNDPKYKKMKNDYSKGALACLIWFGALNVIGSLFLFIGMGIALMIYLKNGGNFIIEKISDVFNIMFTLTHEDYYVVVPIMYTIGYIASSVAAILIGKKIV